MRLLLLLLCFPLLLSAQEQQNDDFQANIENVVVYNYLNSSYRIYRDSYDNTSVAVAYMRYTDDRDDMGREVMIQMPEDAVGPLRVEYRVKDDTLSIDTLDVPVDSTSVGIPNLIPRQYYSYQIINAEGTSIRNGVFYAQGRVRMFSLPTVPNLRDLGGWIGKEGRYLRYGRIFRGAELICGTHNTTSAEDIATFKRLGVAAELDLRRSADFKVQQDTSAFGANAPYLWLNITDAGDLYITRKECFAESFRFVLDNLRNDRPVYIHCIYGADRTGMLCVLLEGLLGVSISDIYRDYELTSFSKYVGGKRNKQMLNNRLTHIEGIFPPSKDINTLMTDYAINDLGITQEEIDEFCSLMLEDREFPILVTTPVSDGNGITTYYSVDGMQRKHTSRGMNIVRYGDGSVKKIVKK